MALKRTNRRERGFSAIETLIALVILTIGMTATATGLTEGRRVAAEADVRQRAIWLAYDKMTEKIALGYDAVRTSGGPIEQVMNGVLVGADEDAGITRRWWVEPGWADRELVRVVVRTEWTRRNERRTQILVGLLASGLAP
ncbi:MAG: type IV pilus modification PilV family protein [Nitrospirota bacterium]